MLLRGDTGVDGAACEIGRRSSLSAALLALPSRLACAATRLRAQDNQDAQTLAEQAIHRLDLQTELRREMSRSHRVSTSACRPKRLWTWR